MVDAIRDRFTALNSYDPVVVPEVLKLANRHLLRHLRQELRHLPRQPRRHRHALPPLCTTSYLQSVGPIDGLKFQIRGGVGDGSAVAAFDDNRQLCTACWPVTRNAHAQLRNAATHAAWATAIAECRDPTQTTAARTKRRNSLLAAKAAEATWTANASVSPITDRDLRERVLPALGAVSLTLMQQVTGLSNSSCSRIRCGLMSPRPRHWQALADLAQKAAGNLEANTQAHSC